MTLDELIKLAHEQPNEALVQYLIDLEVDGTGKFVGFDLSNWYWHKVLHLAHSKIAA